MNSPVPPNGMADQRSAEGRSDCIGWLDDSASSLTACSSW